MLSLSKNIEAESKENESISIRIKDVIYPIPADVLLVPLQNFTFDGLESLFFRILNHVDLCHILCDCEIEMRYSTADWRTGSDLISSSFRKISKLKAVMKLLESIVLTYHYSLLPRNENQVILLATKQNFATVLGITEACIEEIYYHSDKKELNVTFSSANNAEKALHQLPSQIECISNGRMLTIRSLWLLNRYIEENFSNATPVSNLAKNNIAEQALSTVNQSKILTLLNLTDKCTLSSLIAGWQIFQFSSTVSPDEIHHCGAILRKVGVPIHMIRDNLVTIQCGYRLSSILDVLEKELSLNGKLQLSDTVIIEKIINFLKLDYSNTCTVRSINKDCHQFRFNSEVSFGVINARVNYLKKAGVSIGKNNPATHDKPAILQLNGSLISILNALEIMQLRQDTLESDSVASNYSEITQKISLPPSNMRSSHNIKRHGLLYIIPKFAEYLDFKAAHFYTCTAKPDQLSELFKPLLQAGKAESLKNPLSQLALRNRMWGGTPLVMPKTIVVSSIINGLYNLKNGCKVIRITNDSCHIEFDSKVSVGDIHNFTNILKKSGVTGKVINSSSGDLTTVSVESCISKIARVLAEELTESVLQKCDAVLQPARICR